MVPKILLLGIVFDIRIIILLGSTTKKDAVQLKFEIPPGVQIVRVSGLRVLLGCCSGT